MNADQGKMLLRVFFLSRQVYESTSVCNKFIWRTITDRVQQFGVTPNLSHLNKGCHTSASQWYAHLNIDGNSNDRPRIFHLHYGDSNLGGTGAGTHPGSNPDVPLDRSLPN